MCGNRICYRFARERVKKKLQSKAIFRQGSDVLAHEAVKSGKWRVESKEFVKGGDVGEAD